MSITRSLFFLFLFFFLAICPRPPSWSSPYLRGRLQMQLLNEAFRFWTSLGVRGRFKKVTCASDPASRNAAWHQNGFTYWNRKRLVWQNNFFLLNGETARKSAKGRPRSFGAFVPSSDSGTLLKRKCSSWLLSLGGVTLKYTLPPWLMQFWSASSRRQTAQRRVMHALPRGTMRPVAYIGWVGQWRMQDEYRPRECKYRGAPLTTLRD